MNIAVVIRHVPDLIEALEVDDSGAALDLGSAAFIVNECDDHALEQAILMKEAGGATVNCIALDFGDVDNTLYTAAAKGADRIFKIPIDELPPPPRAAAGLFAEAIRPLAADLVLVGVQAHDELDGGVAPFLAAALGLPYVGVVRGVKTEAEPCTVTVCKEFPGAVMARMKVKLPAVLGVLAADQPPRYVPVSRIRGAMKSTQFEEFAVTEKGTAPICRPAARVPRGPEGASHKWGLSPFPPLRVCRLYPPAATSHAEMLAGSESDVAARIVEILAEKGLVK